MPYGNRTGPRGEGSRSGRGIGYCSGSPAGDRLERITAEIAELEQGGAR
ncbi:DUF5320 domain-containing protein [Candidatus Bipolaricaulota bacterium]|nr:DUF5320 domain-containing protein [Candidatus Bipolaricaulota bacterium]